MSIVQGAAKRLKQAKKRERFFSGSKSDRHLQLSSALHDVGERYAVLAEAEKSALRNLLVEERSRICFFANCLSPILVRLDFDLRL